METTKAAETKASAAGKEESGCALPKCEAKQDDNLLGQLQGTIGNRALGRMIQAKLGVSDPGDVYEQKADRVAERVMCMPEPTLQRTCTSDDASLENQNEQDAHDQQEHSNDGYEQLPAIQTKSLEVSNPSDADEREADEVARRVVDGTSAEIHGTGCAFKRKGEGSADTAPEFQAEFESSKSSGQSLPPDVQMEMGSRMGTDLSAVRVHTGSAAHEMSESINAKAFTYGKDIYFNQGNYRPNSNEGKQLLAHELTHTVQQKGDVRRKIQRSMKFEIQTSNYVWQVDAKGASPKHVPRKFGEYGATEEGSMAAYLALGEHGLSPGETYFDEVEGITLMEKAKGIDKTKEAQFIKEYKFAKQVKLNTVGASQVPEIVGQTVISGQFTLVKKTDNKTVKKADEYIPNTFEAKFLNADATQLDVHIKDGKFEEGHITHMKVGKKQKPGMKKEAQYSQSYKFKKPVASESDVLGKLTTDNELTLFEDLDLAKDPDVKPDDYQKGTYHIRYFGSADNLLDVHRNKDGVFQKGIPKYIEKRTFDASKEQTAIELQSESHGFLEFETSKWFRDWDELKLRVQDAVDMTKVINASTSVTDPVLLESMRKKKAEKNPYEHLGRIVTWPDVYSKAHPKIKDALKGGKLLVEIIHEPDWEGFFQTSEGVPLSQFGSLLGDYDLQFSDLPVSTSFVTTYVDKLFSDASKASSVTKGKDESLFADLKGFLQLVVSYIIWGQYYELQGHKDTFDIMARTDFGSMYTTLLSGDEKDLFTALVGSSTKPTYNPILTEELKKEINDKRAVALGNVAPKPPIITLDRETRFFSGGHKGGQARNPSIFSWLKEITKGNDLLSGAQPDVGNAIGGRKVITTPGDKDYKQALFEKRAGVLKPASEWVGYAETMFKLAMTRSADTPDELTTPGISEATKTGLKE